MPINAGSFRNYRECGTFWYMTHLVVRGGVGGRGGVRVHNFSVLKVTLPLWGSKFDLIIKRSKVNLELSITEMWKTARLQCCMQRLSLEAYLVLERNICCCCCFFFCCFFFFFFFFLYFSNVAIVYHDPSKFHMRFDNITCQSLIMSVSKFGSDDLK